MAKKGGKVSNRITKKQLLELLIDFFNRHPDEQYDTRKIFDELGVKSNSLRGMCIHLLDDLVFDGYLVKGNQGSTEEHHGIHVVYTKEGETGDLYIERLTNEIGKNDAVRVATSDAMIQMAALRDGVQRMSSRELIEEIREVEKKISKDIDTINKK